MAPERGRLTSFPTEIKQDSSVRKSHRMITFEEKTGVSIIDFLYHAREIQGLGIKEIADLIQVQTEQKVRVSVGTVKDWLNTFQINLSHEARQRRFKRLWNTDPERKLQLSAKMREIWERNKEEWVSKIHSPQASQKRSESLKGKKISIEVGVRSRLKAKERRLQRGKEVLGDDYKKILADLYWNQEKGFDEIAVVTGLSSNFLRNLFKDLGILRRGKARKAYIEQRKNEQFLERKEYVLTAYEMGEFEFLTPGERRVLQERFLGPSIPSQSDLAGKLKVTRAAISCLELRGLKKLGLGAGER